MKYLFIFLFLSSCATIPRTEFCLINAEEGHLLCHWSNNPDGDSFTIPLSEADNWVATSPDGFAKLEDWHRSNCSSLSSENRP